MRQRTKAEIQTCPHDSPRQEVTTLAENTRRSSFVWKIHGCPQCGGVFKELSFHLHYASRKGDIDRFAKENREAYVAAQREIARWRTNLPEPENEATRKGTVA